MARTPDRTPRSTTQAVKKGPGRKPNPKHTEMYAKSVTYNLAGASPEQVNAVAKAMHQAVTNHEFVKGGKKIRTVTANHVSTQPTKIFDGTILPDSVA